MPRTILVLVVLSAGCRPVGPARSPSPAGALESETKPFDVEWRFHEEGVELYDPNVSNDGREVVFAKSPVTEGEDAPVPELVVARIGERETTTLERGSTPAFSLDGMRIAFDRWVPDSGTEIAIFDRSTGRTRPLPRPPSGDPMGATFTPSGAAVVYRVYNGAGDSDSLETVSLETGARAVLVAPRARRDVYNLEGSAWVEGRLFVLKSVFKSGRYRDSLLDLSSGGRILHESELREPDAPAPWFAPAGDGRILLADGESWVTVELDSDRSSAVPAPADVPRAGRPSPDGEKLAWYDDMDPPEQVLTLFTLPDGHRLGEWRPDGVVQSVSWSPSSDRLAVVVRHVSEQGVLFDELLILAVP